MAETVCLRRSFSNPSFHSTQDDDDPSRALGESISFGRFMSETLDWERWSAFTQNRYLEEAEKYSKPGSVAKMKAHFEAHFPTFAARKLKPPPSITNVDHHPNSSGQIPIPIPIPIPSIQESSTTDHPAGVDLTHSSATCVGSADATLTQTASVDTLQDATPQRMVDVKDKPHKEKEKMHMMTDGKRVDSSVKRLKRNSNISKLSSSISRLATPLRSKKEANATPNAKVSLLSSSSSSRARLATPLRPGNEHHATPSNKMLAKQSTEKKKLTSSTLLQMSNNSTISDSTNKMKNPSSASRKAGLGNVFTPLTKVIRDSFASYATPTRASGNSLSGHPSAIPQSEATRGRVALEKAFDRNRRLEQQLKCPSTGNVKPSTQSPATFSSFSFRTEERAAKRREFFQKRLEKEAENLPAPLIDNAKVKPPDSRKSFQSRNPKPIITATIRTRVLSGNLTKIPPSQHPPKCEAKSTTELAQHKSFRTSQRTAGSKTFSEKCKAVPSTLTMKKKRQENVSPNIL